MELSYSILRGKWRGILYLSLLWVLWVGNSFPIYRSHIIWDLLYWGGTTIQFITHFTNSGRKRFKKMKKWQYSWEPKNIDRWFIDTRYCKTLIWYGYREGLRLVVIVMQLTRRFIEFPNYKFDRLSMVGSKRS